MNVKKLFAIVGIAKIAIIVSACSGPVLPLVQTTATGTPKPPRMQEVNPTPAVVVVEPTHTAPVVNSTATSMPVSTPLVPEGVADVRQQTWTMTTGNWTVVAYEGATEQMRGWFNTIQNLAPASWANFPNVDNPQVGFEARNGLEYGLDERNYCPQETCDIVVAAGEYNLISGDHNLGFVSCEAAEGRGCALMLINVGEVTANFEQVVVNNGFSVAGRYWNGDELEQAVWGGLSHMTANMLDYPTTLNPANSSNAGANCSVRTGCESVLARVVVMSGNHILVVAETTVRR